jgi:hypothetical protein
MDCERFKLLYLAEKGEFPVIGACKRTSFGKADVDPVKLQECCGNQDGFGRRP